MKITAMNGLPGKSIILNSEAKCARKEVFYKSTALRAQPVINHRVIEFHIHCMHPTIPFQIQSDLVT